MEAFSFAELLLERSLGVVMKLPVLDVDAEEVADADAENKGGSMVCVCRGDGTRADTWDDREPCL